MKEERLKNLSNVGRLGSKKMADPKGFEPMTSTSVVWRSNPTELRVRMCVEHPRVQYLRAFINLIFWGKFAILVQWQAVK